MYQKTKETFFSTELNDLDSAWHGLAHMLDHRPHPTKIELHKANILSAFKRIEGQFPAIDFSKWQAKIKAQQGSL
jgi:hypothetical protein